MQNRSASHEIAIQLAAVTEALAAIEEEPDLEQRAQGRAIAMRAIAAIQRERDADEKRQAFRVIRGGAVAVPAVAVGGWLREVIGYHRAVAAGTAAAAAAVAAGALLAVSVWPGGDRLAGPPGRRSVAAPTVTVPSTTAVPSGPVSAVTPDAGSSRLPDRFGSGPGGVEMEPAGLGPGSRESVGAGVGPSPSPSVPVSVGPAVSSSDGPLPSPTGAPSASPSVSQTAADCVVDLPVPLIGVEVGRVVCL